MIEKDAYRAEKEAREKRLMAYSDRIQNRMMEASSEIIDELVVFRQVFFPKIGKKNSQL